MADKIFPTGFTQIGSVTATCTFPIDDGSTNYYAAISQIPSNIVYQDEGTNLNTAGQVTTVDFVGAGVSAGYSGGKITVTVSGGSVSDGDKGDVTVSGGGATWTIDNDAVTYAKIQDVSATDRLLGRTSSGSGEVEEIPISDFAQSLIQAPDAPYVLSALSAHGVAIATRAGFLTNY